MKYEWKSQGCSWIWFWNSAVEGEAEDLGLSNPAFRKRLKTSNQQRRSQPSQHHGRQGRGLPEQKAVADINCCWAVSEMRSKRRPLLNSTRCSIGAVVVNADLVEHWKLSQAWVVRGSGREMRKEELTLWVHPWGTAKPRRVGEGLEVKEAFLFIFQCWLLGEHVHTLVIQGARCSGMLMTERG